MLSRHFLDIDQVDPKTLRAILGESQKRKLARTNLGMADTDADSPLSGKILAMLFVQPSTRTRVSFDVAMRQLGGETLVLNSEDLQLDRGESMADTARVLSRYVDAIMLRTKSHDMLEELVQNASVPVINGLTDVSHPCQVMADVMTFEEHRGAISGRIIAWSGAANNVATSWIHGAARFGYKLRLACPEPFEPSQSLIDRSCSEGASISVLRDPFAAVEGADCVMSDTWTSMHESRDGSRDNMLAPYQVNDDLMDAANTNAIFMHCLPAHRGEEVTASVIDGVASVVWHQAENRLHAQKGILTWCLK